ALDVDGGVEAVGNVVARRVAAGVDVDARVGGGGEARPAAGDAAQVDAVARGDVVGGRERPQEIVLLDDADDGGRSRRRGHAGDVAVGVDLELERAGAVSDGEEGVRARRRGGDGAGDGGVVDLHELRFDALGVGVDLRDRLH